MCHIRSQSPSWKRRCMRWQKTLPRDVTWILENSSHNDGEEKGQNVGANHHGPAPEIVDVHLSLLLPQTIIVLCCAGVQYFHTWEIKFYQYTALLLTWKGGEGVGDLDRGVLVAQDQALIYFITGDRLPTNRPLARMTSRMVEAVKSCSWSCVELFGIMNFWGT